LLDLALAAKDSFTVQEAVDPLGLFGPPLAMENPWLKSSVNGIFSSIYFMIFSKISYGV